MKTMHFYRPRNKRCYVHFQITEVQNSSKKKSNKLQEQTSRYLLRTKKRKIQNEGNEKYIIVHPKRDYRLLNYHHYEFLINKIIPNRVK